MADIDWLLTQLQRGALTRRQFFGRAAALGLSASFAARLAAGSEAVFAQDASPVAGGRPGPAADTVTFSQFNVDQAPLNIQNGDMDLYLFGLKTPGAQSLEGNADVRVVRAPASTLSLILNPAPANEGELNPFSIVEVRRAMQFLVNRDFIANDIYQGRAVPMFTSISPLDYDQLTIFPIVSAANIRYDAEFAKQQITAAMQTAGAQLGGDGKWAFNGNPIQIKFVIRVEDERRDIGDNIRQTLEELGFALQPIYQQFGPAQQAVYQSDPKTFQWHIYTEGWGRGGSVRYDDAGIASYTSPWLANMPGWQAVGFWQYENQELDDLSKKLYRGQFASREERDQLFQQVAQLGLLESVRVWLVTALQSFPVRADVQNLTEDLVSGPKNIYALRGASVPGRSDLKVGHQWVWTESSTWNPVGGFGDVYSGDIRRNIIDPPLTNNPGTGLPEPFRADYAVETGGPNGTLSVPADAVMWDAANDAWAPVAAGTTAVSKVTFDYARYAQSTWHHGQPIVMADLLYSIAQSWEIAFDEQKIQIETVLGITSRPFLETYKGFRLAGPTSIEVYVDYWHFEESYIASYATPASITTPWELLFALDDVVYTQRLGAYTDISAARFGIPWLSLVTESDARSVLRSLTKFKNDGTLPQGVFAIGGQTLVTPEEAAARYDACAAWFQQTNHLVIGNGAFQLTRYDPPAQFAQLDAFRAEGYPFTAADFQPGTPQSLVIAPVTPPTIALGEPISLQVSVTGPGTIGVQYTLIDAAAGAVVTSGSGTDQGGGTFQIDVDPNATAALFPGLYQLFVLASSDAVAQVAQQRIDLNIGV